MDRDVSSEHLSRRGIKLFSRDRGDIVRENTFKASTVTIPGLGSTEFSGDNAKALKYDSKDGAIFLKKNGIEEGLAHAMVANGTLNKAAILYLYIYSSVPLPNIQCLIHYDNTTLICDMDYDNEDVPEEPEKKHYAFAAAWYKLDDEKKEHPFTLFGELDEELLSSLEFSFIADLTNASSLREH